jgi:NADH-quinone oxidoreductase subunit G
MIHRGEHSEITTVEGRTIDSELSGNMIDICPVGALTSKPFRYSARTWELSRRKSVSPHDSTGANLVVQVKAGKVMRVLPLENESVNECWIADRDRFSYEALNGPSRLTADDQAGRPVERCRLAHGAGLRGRRPQAREGRVRHLSTWARWRIPRHPRGTAPAVTKLVRGLGSESIDHRLRHADFTNTAATGRPAGWAAASPSLSSLDRAFVVGSFLRKDHPLFAQRLRQAARRGARIASLNAVHDDWAMPLAATLTAAPSQWLQQLADVAACAGQGRRRTRAAAGRSGRTPRPWPRCWPRANTRPCCWARPRPWHPQAAQLLAVASGSPPHRGHRRLPGRGGNASARSLCMRCPGRAGLNAGQMLTQPMKALLLLHAEPHAGRAPTPPPRRLALASLGPGGGDDAVLRRPRQRPGPRCRRVAAHRAVHRDRRQLRQRRRSCAVLPRRGQAAGRNPPGLEALRVLGNLLGLPGFEQETVEAVRAEALGDGSGIAGASTTAAAVALSLPARARRWSASPMCPSTPDGLVRRAPSLQATADARARWPACPSALWAQAWRPLQVPKVPACASCKAAPRPCSRPGTTPRWPPRPCA